MSAEHACLRHKLDELDELERELEDLVELEQLGADDPELGRELADQRARLAQRLARLSEERLFSGKYDRGDAVVTVNAGAGGTDAQDWAEMVLRMLVRWAERRGFQAELVDLSPGEEAGIKSATVIVRGENAYGLASAERGVHRLVRISPFDSQKRRHTAFAGVDVAPLVEEVTDIEIDPDDLQIDTYRASGAGGQHVNKTDSAVRITHKPTGIVVQCQNERSQSANKETALRILRARLLELEEQRRQEEIRRERGDAQDVNFGSQIRSYVLHPYRMVKDHRTGVEIGDVDRVLDGDLDELIAAELARRAGERGAVAAGS
ncbi:Peptide chain release factor RF2 [bacterium HR41]|nr:Peptide chain release factor RF2 [bacterium HR41]